MVPLPDVVHLDLAEPIEGDSVEWAGWRFEVVDMDGNAIDKVLATKR
jgi:CBS domain containing-hemolysin-like protein